MEPVEEPAYKFAPRVIKMVRAMPHESTNQIIGVNVEEAIGGTSGREFATKMYNARGHMKLRKEAERGAGRNRRGVKCIIRRGGSND